MPQRPAGQNGCHAWLALPRLFYIRLRSANGFLVLPAFLPRYGSSASPCCVLRRLPVLFQVTGVADAEMVATNVMTEEQFQLEFNSLFRREYPYYQKVKSRSLYP